MSGKEARLAHLEARADEFDELIGRHAARFASFFELFDEMRGASRSAHGRIDNLIERLAEVETKVDDLDGPEFTDGSPDLPPVAERRTLYRVAGAGSSVLMFDPAAAIRVALSNPKMANRKAVALSEFAPSDDFEGWRGEGSHLYEVRGDRLVHIDATPGLVPPDLGDLEVTF